MNRRFLFTTVLMIGLLADSPPVQAQGTVADYVQAITLRDRYQALAINVPEPIQWIRNTNRFWYRKTVRGGNAFVLVNADTKTKEPAFDHAKLADALSAAMGTKYTPVTLPFTTFSFVDDDRAIEFQPGATTQGAPGTPRPTWRCTLDSYTCKESRAAGRGGRGGGLAGPVRAPFDINGAEPKKSPDGKFEALVRNYNVAVREAGSRTLTALTSDGSEGNYYDPESLEWSPDSTKLAVYKVAPGFRRYIHYVQSSPEDQLQPTNSTMQYAKPGDMLDVETPVIVSVADKTAHVVSNELFQNAYDLSRLVWRKNSAAITFEYNQRGHQLYRVIEVDAATGTARAVINEEAKTFFCYSGKKFRRDLGDGREVIWMSERDGWNHLYLYDGVSGTVKNQITRGQWPVRSVVDVNEDKRQIWFSASGMYPGKDPYFVHFYRINFDGTELTPLTSADANHNVSLSPDMTYFVDTYSRVDAAPIAELHRTSDKALLLELEKADITGLMGAGWKPPEVFTAKGRDGVTDIWGVIYRPTHFDPAKKYPVIENIYAGPHSSFVPKSFAAFNQMQAQADLGFIVVQIDGMGTSNRSKAFHDVAWKNIKDAGFPDRILWHKAAAAKYPYYDVSRVGIYGTSAGGQSSLGALLFHPEFYQVAVSFAGCHDNRMDKIWWNEQWMGWPIGPEYSESSNVDNAYRLQGKVLLVVGEMDHNVDPSSTMQVANQLIKHNKDFDLLVVPGMDHGSGGAYGDHKRYDYFVRHLLGTNPPSWTAVADALKPQPKSTSTASGR
ncbi:MAG TPA: DPP IV N-terminal domain-containing protein [Vicinamibacterales bacterium]|nr:DPP IV N-terminal domain-containing protein [Vicinamibacterales bacterium]